ncbi:MAG: hypothetical protein U0800_24610 [Isosphaeraceae bacterium]
MSRCGRLVSYVTSHGFGHLNRTVSVLNRVPGDVPITIRCHPDLFDHWGERLRRPADLEAFVSDAGAINPPGDSAATDGPATLARAMQVHREALGRIDDEADRLRDLDAACILADAPPLPLVAARRAGIPGFLLTNFTWADIYEPHARRIGGEAPGFVRDLKAAYRQATALFRAEPALSMKWLPNQIEVGVVATRGRDRGKELRETLGLGRAEKLVYFYVGRYGQEAMGWDRIAKLGAFGFHFVGFHPAPVGPLENLHVVPATEWTGAELAASADAIVAKAGYGSTGEAMLAGTPMIYPPRVGFAEHRALDRGLRAWGGGFPVPRRDFDAFRLEKPLGIAVGTKPGPPPYPADGSRRVAEHLARISRGIAAA